VRVPRYLGRGAGPQDARRSLAAPDAGLGHSRSRRPQTLLWLGRRLREELEVRDPVDRGVRQRQESAVLLDLHVAAGHPDVLDVRPGHETALRRAYTRRTGHQVAEGWFLSVRQRGPGIRQLLGCDIPRDSLAEFRPPALLVGFDGRGEPAAPRIAVLTVDLERRPVAPSEAIRELRVLLDVVAVVRDRALHDGRGPVPAEDYERPAAALVHQPKVAVWTRRLVEDGVGVRFDANKGTPMKEWLALDPEADIDWSTLAHDASRFVG